MTTIASTTVLSLRTAEAKTGTEDRGPQVNITLGDTLVCIPTASFLDAMDLANVLNRCALNVKRRDQQQASLVDQVKEFSR